MLRPLILRLPSLIEVKYSEVSTLIVYVLHTRFHWETGKTLHPLSQLIGLIEAMTYHENTYRNFVTFAKTLSTRIL